MTDKRVPAGFRKAVLVSSVFILMTGCSALKTRPDAAPGPAPAQANVKAEKPVTMYYDFGDVLLPRELKVDKDESFIMNTPDAVSGVLMLSGNVESRSLTAFFKNKMPADGWRLVSAITAPRTKMLFRKPASWCVISIVEGRLNTDVEIWVSPSMAPTDASMGLTKE